MWPITNRNAENDYKTLFVHKEKYLSIQLKNLRHEADFVEPVHRQKFVVTSCKLVKKVTKQIGVYNAQLLEIL